VAHIFIAYLMWLCVHGVDTNLLAAAVPVHRPSGATEFHIVGFRPIPEGSRRSLPPPALWFEDDKRPIPSSPDALHNR
jgi:hypothetical protein